MNLRRVLELKKRNLLFVDPGINCTGFCALTAGIVKKKLSAGINMYGSIVPSLDSVHDRAQEVAEGVVVQANRNNVHYVILEYPPDTLYGYQRMSRGGIVARAQSIFKLFGVCHEIHATLVQNGHLNFFTVFPKQWQPSKKRRGGLDTKVWSLKRANILLSKFYDDERHTHSELHTKEHENIADAIAMSFSILRKVEEEDFDLITR